MRVLVTGGAGFTPPLSVDESQVSCSLKDPSRSMHYVYILRSLIMASWYIGCTSDLRNRLKLHPSGAVLATKGKGPWELLYYEVYCQQATAYRRERALKQFGGAYRQLRRRLATEEITR